MLLISQWDLAQNKPCKQAFTSIFSQHLSFVPYRSMYQWRNSYGLRVGKPAGTRAKGAPARCHFTLVFQLRLPIQKGAPLQLFLHSVFAKFP